MRVQVGMLRFGFEVLSSEFKTCCVKHETLTDKWRRPLGRRSRNLVRDADQLPVEDITGHDFPFISALKNCL